MPFAPDLLEGLVYASQKLLAHHIDLGGGAFGAKHQEHVGQDAAGFRSVGTERAKRLDQALVRVFAPACPQALDYRRHRGTRSRAEFSYDLRGRASHPLVSVSEARDQLRRDRIGSNLAQGGSGYPGDVV